MKTIIYCFVLLFAVAQSRSISEVWRPESRIVGGDVAQRGQFPYQAALILDGMGVCGGALVSDTIVLTASHCLDKFLTFEVILGAQNLYDESESGRQSIFTRDATLHEDFSLTTLVNDIAFLRLPSPAIVNQSAPEISPELKFAYGTVISEAECQSYYTSMNFNITAGHICYLANSGNVCNSDSGGPMVVTDTDGEPLQVGVCSFGTGACSDLNPAGYARTTYYLDWIESNTGIPIRP
ncbi:hypothetical protein B566_EDAN004886 [Ephemera danica]|nr:hypothetical protein B566_EDAN004886 [Ephemera danica]